MKLKKLLEKKEAVGTSPSTNMTLHYDPAFSEVGEEGKPEFHFSVSVSTVGGKEYYRAVADKEEEVKLAEAIKLELRRALRKFDGRVEEIIEKYNIKAR